MRLVYLTLITFVLLAVTIDGAKKKKNNHRDRDEGSSRQQLTEDVYNWFIEEATHWPQRGGDREAERQQKRKGSLVDVVNCTINNFSLQTSQNSIIDPRQVAMYAEIEIHRSGRSRRAENTLQKAKEMDELPLNNNNNQQEPPARHRPRRDGNTLHKAKEMDEIPLKTSNVEKAHKSRSRRAENEHAHTREVILTRAQELNDGEKMPLEIDENTGSRPDYRKKSRTRRENGEIVMGKAQEVIDR
ncbi:hypothetical protein PRIPAC_97679 [Pristionchus pacificus]|uniref:Uncharacterized protein n=1 Tax=Pristionchus pacificus TaxID=54126 RepID=A0A2A6BCH3_PRIPA|nr:hypothetical protein PRIPAC_97679 [Pristionchus pacificus]|eukprot:PDM63590.1 hypothetical protein PRIPAC_49563 [Pristionchus pacificus]